MPHAQGRISCPGICIAADPCTQQPPYTRPQCRSSSCEACMHPSAHPSVHPWRYPSARLGMQHAALNNRALPRSACKAWPKMFSSGRQAGNHLPHAVEPWARHSAVTKGPLWMPNKLIYAYAVLMMHTLTPPPSCAPDPHARLASAWAQTDRAGLKAGKSRSQQADIDTPCRLRRRAVLQLVQAEAGNRSPWPCSGAALQAHCPPQVTWQAAQAASMPGIAACFQRSAGGVDA